ncbi:MAG: hypothetical protein ACTSRA_06240 [Promethearchaeota archaeon]
MRGKRHSAEEKEKMQVHVSSCTVIPNQLGLLACRVFIGDHAATLTGKVAVIECID